MPGDKIDIKYGRNKLPPEIITAVMMAIHQYGAKPKEAACLSFLSSFFARPDSSEEDATRCSIGLKRLLPLRGLGHI